MISRRARLVGQKEFQRLFQTGRSARVGGVRLVWRLNKTGFNRVGVVVPNKAVRTIVERNRLKRQVRAVLAELLPLTRQGSDIAILVGARIEPFQRLKDTVVSLLKRAGLFK